MDSRKVHVVDVEYEVELEGIMLPKHKITINKDIIPDSIMSMSVPLSMAATDAIKILAMLDEGQTLDYHVTGKFHASNPLLNLFNFPLDISGTADVKSGYEDYYAMPSATLLNLSGSYNGHEDTSYVFDFEAVCVVQNNDNRSVLANDVSYRVIIEGIPSELENLIDRYPDGLTLEGNGCDTLILPITLILDDERGLQLANSIRDGNIEYEVEGIFHATEVDTLELDFTLPFYISGNLDSDILGGLYSQPLINVTGYSLSELPDQYVKLDIALTVDNTDSRTAVIKSINYQVTVEGVESWSKGVMLMETIGSEPLDLVLPLVFTTRNAFKLLEKLDGGTSLNYVVDGEFHIDDPILSEFDIPINIQGTAYLDVGYEDFYQRPEVTLNDISGDFEKDAQNNYHFDLELSCYVKNLNPNSVHIEDIQYTVNVEGIPSDTHQYSDTGSEPFTLPGNGAVNMILPLSLTLNESDGVTLAQAMNSGKIEYDVEGIVWIDRLNSVVTDFAIPLSLEGTIDSDIIGDLFEQPTIDVLGYRLLELPGDTAHLEIEIMLNNNDTRTAHIYDVEYQAVIDSITALPEHVIIDQTIPEDTLKLCLPLTLLTDDAIQLLNKLDGGESLTYAVTGTFHIDDPVLKTFDLPIDISGTSQVVVGFESFFNQPEVTVNNMSGNYHINCFTSYTITYDVNCTVQNLEARAATIDEIEYTVTIEGTKSAKHYYSNAYSSDFEIGASASENLILPVTFNLNIANGAAMVTALSDGTVEYVIEGTFHVTLVDGTEADFTLPLYVTGSVPATMVAG
jgi:LEA14-like dessication related protein